MIGVCIRPPEMTEKQYHAVNAQIGEAGVDRTDCLVHTCFSEGDQLAIFDAWESEGAFPGLRREARPDPRRRGPAGARSDDRLDDRPAARLRG
ncbi:MAG TPA: hypothetical protein VNF07_03530 [Acidimicrobiales bacterium]|nr:hypothetical protein [Acidimicrobiales bacterium]